MKKIHRIFALLLVFVLVAGLVSCGEDNKTSDIKIGIAAPAVTHGWVAGVEYYAEQYCRDLGYESKTSVSNNAEEMKSSLEELVDWGADVIITYPQWPGMEEEVQKVIDGGTPVVSFDIQIDVEGIYTVTGDNYSCGYESAKYLIEKVGMNSVILVMDVPSSGSVSSLRVQGFEDYLDSIGFDKSYLVEMHNDSFSEADGKSSMERALEVYGRIDAVYAMDDEAAIGCLEAIEESGRTDIKAVNGCAGMQKMYKLILSGKYDPIDLSTTLYSPDMVKRAVDVAVKIVQGVVVNHETTIATAIVNSENAELYIDENNTVF